MKIVSWTSEQTQVSILTELVALKILCPATALNCQMMRYDAQESKENATEWQVCMQMNSKKSEQSRSD